MRGAKPLRPGRVVRLAMLARCGGHRALAARLLGMQQHSFCRWLWTVARAEGTAHLPSWVQRNGPRPR